MTYIDREQFPCVKCDAPGCDEHLMWSAEKPIADVADRGWLEEGPAGAELHKCPTHRVAQQRAALFLSESAAITPRTSPTRFYIYLLIALVIAVAVAAASLAWGFR